MKGNKILSLLTIILPIIIVFGMGATLAQNYIYNHTLRRCDFSEAESVNGIFEFDEASVEFVTR